MIQILTNASLILSLIAIVNPIYMAFKCRKECDEYSQNWYIKNHTRPSAYLGVHISPPTKGFLKTPDEEMLKVELTIFTLGFFFFYWQVTFKNLLDEA